VDAEPSVLTEVIEADLSRRLYAVSSRPTGLVCGPVDDGVAAGEGQPEATSRPIPFCGIVAPISLLVREVNRAIEVPSGPLVVPEVQYTISVNGLFAYSPTAGRFHHHTQALIDASWAVERLLGHPVAWWDSSQWRGRPVYLDGAAATVVDYSPTTGIAIIEAGDGQSVGLDVLRTDRVGWYRDDPDVGSPALDSTEPDRDTIRQDEESRP